VVFHIRDDNRTSPLQVIPENNTRGAYGYRWLFEGGEPASSSEKNPGTVSFTAPGEHTVTLEAWNEGTRTSKSFPVRVDSAVVLDFTVEAEINSYAPALFHIKNLSSGGSTYHWSFEGGIPGTHDGISPPAVRYEKEGTYRISLSVWNGSATFESVKEIEVGEALDASFTIIPSFEDEDDMEAPLRASFTSRLQGVETLVWSCQGATLTNAQSREAELHIPRGGKYAVCLEVSNGKETKKIFREITVEENSNLRTHTNIRLGINTAQANYPVYYSTRLRKAFKIQEVNEDNGPMIDIVFFGLSPNFTYNMFVSPSRLSETTFPDIPGAVHTRFINKTESGPVNLTVLQFTDMHTDALLRNLPIFSAPYGNEFFTGIPLPRVVLFETSNRRKGAILIKETVSGGKDSSYITVDIKVQKND
jgi:PKD repeat protein